MKVTITAIERHGNGRFQSSNSFEFGGEPDFPLAAFIEMVKSDGLRAILIEKRKRFVTETGEQFLVCDCGDGPQRSQAVFDLDSADSIYEFVMNCWGSLTK